MDLAPLAYQYGLGAVVLSVGLWAGYKTGVWGPGRWFWGGVMVGGWLFMLALQGGLQLWAGTG